MIYNNILETIGRTPLIRLAYLNKGGVSVYGKAECYNPTGSVKDRAAIQMINEAIVNNRISESTTIIEATAGNSGISLAMVCAVKGLKCILIMPENVGIERINNFRAYGAQIVLTAKSLGMKGAIDKAEELKKEIGDAYIMSPFSNVANSNSHYFNTAREIFTDLRAVKWIVGGLGTGGTIIGLTRYIVTNRLESKICVVEPENNRVLEGGASAAHKIQGIGAGFIPQIVGDKTFDRIEHVSDDDAINCARELTVKTGLFCGISSGAAVAAAKRIIREVEQGEVVIILPDRGDKYLNSPLCKYE